MQVVRPAQEGVYVIRPLAARRIVGALPVPRSVVFDLPEPGQPEPCVFHHGHRQILFGRPTPDASGRSLRPAGAFVFDETQLRGAEGMPLRLRHPAISGQMDFELAIEVLPIAHAMQHRRTEELDSESGGTAIGGGGPASDDRHSIESLVERFHPELRYGIRMESFYEAFDG